MGEISKPPPAPRSVLHQDESLETGPVPDDDDDYDDGIEATIAYTDIFMMEETGEPANAMKHMRIMCGVNGVETGVLLDVGAAGCCMSTADADRLGVEVNADVAPRQCRGIGRGVIHARVSHPVPVEIGERVAYPEFSIIDNGVSSRLIREEMASVVLISRYVDCGAVAVVR